MTTPTQPREVTPGELLDIREKTWSAQLGSVSLAAEFRVLPEHTRQTLGVLGNRYLRYKDEPDRRKRSLRSHPAVHVLSTTVVATEEYESGTFWPKLADAIQVPNTQLFQQEWGEAFLKNLQTLGLPDFKNAEADAGTKFMGRILLHCGVPTNCLDDYYRLVTRERSKDPYLSAAEFVSWAVDRAESGRLHNVEMPVNRFLRFGGDFAIDVTDRIFDLLDIVAAGGDGSDVPLPDRFRVKAQELARHGELERTKSPAARTHRTYPRLVLDPYGRGPMLELPAMAEFGSEATVWTVHLDGEPQQFVVETPWLDSGDFLTTVEVPLPRPIRLASAAVHGHEQFSANINVVDDQDPVLAFDENGSLLPPGIALPGAPVWVLVPGPASELQLVGEAHVLAEENLPPGWANWSLTLWDLSEAEILRFGDEGKTHPIRRTNTARIETDEPLRGVRSANGSPVLSSLPRVLLPESSGADVEWEVSLLDSKGQLIKRARIRQDVESENLWADVARPVLGSFTVRVRGPWGRGATRSVFIAEGLQVACTPTWRNLTKDGLAPATVSLTTAAGMNAEDETLSLGSTQTSLPLRLSTQRTSAWLKVTPDHSSTAYQTDEKSLGPSVRPMFLSTEKTLLEPGTLILHLGIDEPQELAVLSGTEVVQTLRSSGGQRGVHRFKFTQLVDTLKAHKQLAVHLMSQSPVPVALVRPERLFSSVNLVDGKLLFTDSADVPGLTALVHLTRAPWREPAVLPITDGAAHLPPEYINAGPLRIAVRIEDPWAPEPIPAWPDRRRSVPIDSPGHLNSPDPEETRISAFLEGTADFPEETSNFSRIWSISATLPNLHLNERFKDVRRELEEAMFRQPRQALESLSDSPIHNDVIPSLIVRSRLAWSDLTQAHEAEAPLWTERNALAATLLSAADSSWSEEEIDAATNVCGDVVLDVLLGEDPYASAGRFDANTDVLAQNPAQRELVSKSMGLVPKGLLSEDTRVLAVMDLLSKINDEKLVHLKKHGWSIMKLLKEILPRIAPPETSAAVEARMHPNPAFTWHLAPAISLGLAVVARIAARGSAAAREFVEYERNIWVDIATVAPQLVTIDLILAELLVAAQEPQKETSVE